MAKKADKDLKKLRKAVTELEEQNERLTETLEKQGEEHARALREIRDLLQERLPDRDGASTEPTQGDPAPDGTHTEGPEVTGAAERRAKELGVDISDVEGTGSGGRVLVKDVEAAADGGR